MKIFLLVLLGLVVLLLGGAWFAYARMKRYLAGPQNRIEGVVTEIEEEIDGYHEKTQ